MYAPQDATSTPAQTLAPAPTLAQGFVPAQGQAPKVAPAPTYAPTTYAAPGTVIAPAQGTYAPASTYALAPTPTSYVQAPASVPTLAPAQPTYVSAQSNYGTVPAQPAYAPASAPAQTYVTATTLAPTTTTTTTTTPAPAPASAYAPAPAPASASASAPAPAPASASVSASGRQAITLDFQFKGHKESVLCLAVHPSDDALVCSGSEDGTARIWDARKKTSVRCLQTSHKHPVNSVTFSPTAGNPIVYIAEGHYVYCFDLRRPDVILKETSAVFDYNSEEINQIALSEDGKFLAACDDSGEAVVIDTQVGKLAHTLARRHKNICASILFRKGNPQEVITGGLDCNLVHWNIVRAKHLHIENLATEPKTAQTFNPPMAHSLSMDATGQCVAAGLGDGSVAVFSLGAWTRTHSLIGHTNSVSVVQYAPFAPNTHLFSGSDDSTIVLWDLTKNPRYNIHAPKGATPMVLQITNSSKINYLAATRERRLFVADQSHNISVFSING